MYEFSDMAEVESTLEQLANREDGPFVVRLAREPGKRESRYMHLFSGEVEDQPAVMDMSNAVDGDLQARVEALEIEVAEHTLQRIFTHFICILIHNDDVNQCKSAYRRISGKRRHSGDMGAKSQLNGGIFYIILWLMHVLQALSDKKII